MTNEQKVLLTPISLEALPMVAPPTPPTTEQLQRDAGYHKAELTASKYAGFWTYFLVGIQQNNAPKPQNFLPISGRDYARYKWIIDAFRGNM